jgi:hypothetical protein
MSFTRTAVAEIKERIKRLSTQEASAAAVRVTTMDSHVWHLLAGFEPDDEKELFRSYDQNIESAIRLLRTGNPDVRDYFESLEHLIVDEAQDLVGIRAELVEAMIELLSDTCGLSVFTDDAQAIYGFSEDDVTARARDNAETFVDRVRNGNRFGLQSLQLSTIHRTDSESLRSLFYDARQVVLDDRHPPDERITRLIQEVRESAAEKVGDILAQGLEGRDDVLVLFRRRVEVLTASSFLRDEGVQHRVRMSGLPRMLHPWIGVLFWDVTETYMAQTEFLDRWEARIPQASAPMDFAAAWELLFELAGERGGRLEMRRLRARLSRSSLPVQLSAAETGYAGPILSTIHASKGRESPDVHLMLPRNPCGADLDEECRVIFVGATRPRQQLKVGDGYRVYGAASLDSGRTYRMLNRSHRAQVEMGREGDVLTDLQVNQDLYPDPIRALEVQSFLSEQSGQDLSVKLVANRSREFRYEIYLQDELLGAPLGVMNRLLNRDLFSIAKRIAGRLDIPRLRPGETILHCHLIGVGTRVLKEDDPVVRTLHPPFDKTGTFLVPIISGFTTIPFLRY